MSREKLIKNFFFLTNGKNDSIIFLNRILSGDFPAYRLPAGKVGIVPIDGRGGMNLRKEDIVRDIASETGLSMVETKAVVNAFMSKIIEGITAGKRIELRGFGVFTSRVRKGRVARNPKTGKKLQVPPCAIPVFKPSKTLKKILKEVA